MRKSRPSGTRWHTRFFDELGKGKDRGLWMRRDLRRELVALCRVYSDHDLNKQIYIS